MKKTAKVMAIAALTLGLCASAAQAVDSVYVIDGRGLVATSGFGLCWRTGFWTPAAAATDPNGCKCDKDLIAKAEWSRTPLYLQVNARLLRGDVASATVVGFDWDKLRET